MILVQVDRSGHFWAQGEKNLNPMMGLLIIGILKGLTVLA